MTMNGDRIIVVFSLLYGLWNSSCSASMPCNTIDSLKLGCFTEHLWDRSEFSVSGGNYNSSSLKPEHCVRLCGQLSFRYSALQNGELCLCGNTYGFHGPASTCNVVCTGDVSSFCGGKEANMVYNSTPFTGHFAISKPNQPLQLFVQASITAVYLNGTVSDPGFSVDISEETGFSSQKSINLPFNFSATRWGKKRLTAINSVSGSLKTASYEIDVVSPVKHLNVSCPNYVKTKSEFKCTVKVYQGTKMQATWKLAEGSSGNISLPDPVYLGVGPPIPQWIVPNIISLHPSGVFLIPSSVFVRDAMVLGLEFYGNATGNIKIFIARPMCILDGQQYCINTSTCVSIDDTCALNTKQQCFAPQILNISSSKCQNPSMCNSSILQSAAYQSSLSSLNYSVVCDFGSIQIQLGYNLFVPPENKACRAQQGDILGWAIDGLGLIGHRNGAKKVLKYTIPSSEIKTGYNFTHGDPYTEIALEYLLRAVSSEATTFLTRHVIPKPGVEYYHVNITNNVTSLPVEYVREIRVQQPVTSITAVYPRGFDYFGSRKDAQVELVLNISAAPNLTVIWANASTKERYHTFFGRANQNEGFFLNNVNLSFSHEGFFQLYVEASNGISSVNTTVSVLVGGEIIGLNGSLSQPDKPVYQGLQTSLLATIASGPRVRYRWIINNNHSAVFVNSNETTHAFRQVGITNVTIVVSNQAFTVTKSFTVIVVNPLSLSVPEWTASNISVTLNCTLNGDFAPNQKYLWEFGDSLSFSGINASSIQHTFAKGGQYNISCRVVNPVLLQTTSSIFILEAVHGQCLKPFSGVELFDNKTFKAIYNAGNNLTFSWAIQGESVSSLAVCSTKNFTYHFVTPGKYTVVLNISNAISFLSCDKEFLVEEKISNVSISASPNPAPSNTTVIFEIVKGAGTNVTYKLNFSDGLLITNFDGPRLVLNRTFTAGKRQVRLTAANTVSDEIIFYNLTVQDVVKNLSIDVDADGIIDRKTFVAVGETKTLRSQAEQGTDLDFTWMISDEVYHDKGTLNLSKTYVKRQQTFMKEQEIVVNVTAYNLVSRLSHCITLHAQKAIKGFNVTVPSCVASGEEFEIRLVKSEGGNVKYIVSFGNGSEDVTTTKSTIKKTFFSNTTYNLTATAFNQIGHVTIPKQVSVQFRIKDLTCGTFDKVVANGSQTRVFWKISNGSDVTFKVNFGDGSPEVNLTSKLLGKMIHLNHTYHEAKQYQVEIKASNLLDQQSCLVEAIVQQLIKGLQIEEQSSRNVVIYKDSVIITASVTQGTNVTYMFDFDDNSDPISTKDGQAKHEFKYQGDFTPNVTASNLISNMFILALPIKAKPPIDPQPIRGLKILVAPTKYGEESKIRITWDEGALFDCELNTGENKRDIEYKYLGPPFFHNYSKPDHFELSIKCFNKFSNKSANTVAKVEVPIEGLNFTNLNSSSHNIERVFGKSHNIQWTWSRGSSVECSAKILGKNGQILNSLHRSLDLKPEYFEEPGTYIITVHAINAVTKEQTISVTITLIQSITHAQLLVNPYVQVDYPAMAFLIVKTGSHATSVWSYGKAGKAGKTEIIKSLSNNKYIRFRHRFGTSGVYRINVTVWNRYSDNTTVSSTISIMNPVVGFSMTPQQTLQWPANRVNFQFKRNQTLLPPTNATYRFVFGDNTTSEEMNLDSANNNFFFDYSFKEPGCYVTTLTIYNKASYVRLVTPVSIIQKVDSLTLEAKHSEQSSTPETPGRGKDRNIFPLEYPVSFRAKHLNGTCVQYDWFFGDTETKFKETIPTINHAYPLPGNYSVRVRVYNGINVREKSSKVIILRSIVGLYLVSNSPVKPGSPVTFVIFCAQPGNNTRFVIETGENRNITNVPFPKRGSGAQAMKVFSPNIQLPFDSLSYYASVVSYTYETSKSVFKARVIAWNEVSLKTARTTAVVIGWKCSIPDVEPYGGRKTLETALPFKYDRDFRISSRVNISCNGQVKALFRWSVFRADTYYVGNASMPPDENSDISSRLPSHVIRNQSSITVPKKSLKPGYYLLQITVTLSGVNLTNTAQQYVKISTPLVEAKIEGGSARSRGWDIEVVLNASQSHDPLSTRHDKLAFEWYCELINNSFGVFGKGGCFGRGEGLVENREAVFRIRAKSLLESATYNFRVTVTPHDKKRTVTASQSIKILQGKPPDINIKCVYNCEGKVTSDERLAIKTYCADCQDDTATLQYSWTAQKVVNGKGQAFKLWPNGTLTNVLSKYVVVKEKVLEKDAIYILKVQAWRERGVKAFAEYRFTTNSPPKNGKCTITPTNGMELDTSFYVTCNSWVEEDTPLTYEILLKNNDNSSGSKYTLMWYGPELSSSKVILTAGEKENNHTLDLIVRVRDVYGAVNDTTHKIKVVPLSGEITSQRLLGFAGDFDTILDRGDVMGAFQLTTVLGSIINKQATQNITRKGMTVQDKTLVRSNLTVSMERVLPRDIQAVRQLSGSLEIVAQEPDELSIKAQESSVSIYTRAVDVVMNSAEKEREPAQIEVASQGSLTAISSFITASSIKSEKLYLSSSADLEKTQRVATQLVDLTNKLANATLINKLPGEKETTYKTKYLRLVVKKVLPEDLEKPIDTSGSSGRFVLPGKQDMLEGIGTVPDAVSVAFSQMNDNPFSGTDSSLMIKSSTMSLILMNEDSQQLNIAGLSSYIDIYLQNKMSQQQKELNTSKTPQPTGTMTTHNITLKRSENAIIADIIPENKSATINVYFRYNSPPTLKEYDFLETLPRYPVNESSNITSPGPYTFFVSNDRLNGSGNYYIGVLPSQNQAWNLTKVTVNYTFDVFSSGCYFWSESKKVWTSEGCRVGNETSRSMTHCQCTHLTWFGGDLFIPPNKINWKDDVNNLINLGDSPALVAAICVVAGVYILAMVWARRWDKKDTIKVGLIAVPDNDLTDRFRYEVTIYTGRMGRSTTSTISMILYGELAESHPVTLMDKERPIFESGSVDSFFVTVPEALGPLNYIRIWHDNSGVWPAWYLNQVIIRDIDTDERFVFLCYRWFACDEDDGQVERIIPIAGKEELREFTYLFRNRAKKDFSDAHLWFSIALRPPRSQFTRVQRVSCCLSLLLCTMLANVLWYDVPESKTNTVIFESGFIRLTWHSVVVGIYSSLIVFPINLLIAQVFRSLEKRPARKRIKLENNKKQETRDLHSRNGKSVLKLNDIYPITRTESTETYPDKELQKSKKEDFSNIKKQCFGAQESFEDDLLCLLMETRLLEDHQLAKEQREMRDSLDALKSNFFEHEEMRKKASISPDSECSLDYNDSSRLVKPENIKPATIKIKVPKPKFLLPWWFVFVGWFLCISTSCVAAFLTVLIGNKFKRPKQEQWLFAMLVSLVQDIFISQPLKVIGFALFFALILKKPDKSDESINAELAKDEEWLKQNVGGRRRNALIAEQPKYMAPDEAMLKKARIRRFKERKMFSVIREIVMYAMFVWVVLLIAYGHKDPNAHALNQGIENMLTGTGNSWLVDYQPKKPRNGTKRKFLKVSGVGKFWKWANNTLLPSLYNGPWYNGKKDIDGYMADRSSWLVGVARLRQLRVKTDTCKLASVFEGFLRDCNEPYSWEAEETTKQFKPGWLTALPNFTTTNRAWQYRKSLELKSLPFLGRLAFYSGGGYAEDLGPTVEEARRKIEELESDNWIDKQTRAVFVEVTIYNPHTNIHCVAFLVLEVSASGGTFPFVELLVTRIDRYTGNFKIFVLIFELAFVCFIIFFTYKLIKGMLKIGPLYYFKQYWNWVELALVSLSWTAFVLYFVRLGINAFTQKEYRKNPNQFVNFHPLAASDQLFGYVYAFVVFLVSLKFLRLFRFNRRMSLLASTLKNASMELICFSVVFGIVFMAFVHFSYLVFSPDLYMFHTVLSCAETLISVMLGKFSYERLLATNRVLAPLMFFSYSFLVVWVLINMFVSIIIENFQEVKHNNDLQSNEYEIVDFMTDQFKVWLGWSTWGFIFTSKNRVRDFPMGKPKYKKRKKVNQAENLKNRVDQLVNMIQTVYFEKGDFLRNDGEVTYISRENALY